MDKLIPCVKRLSFTECEVIEKEKPNLLKKFKHLTKIDAKKTVVRKNIFISYLDQPIPISQITGLFCPSLNSEMIDIVYLNKYKNFDEKKKDKYIDISSPFLFDYDFIPQNYLYVSKGFHNLPPPMNVKVIESDDMLFTDLTNPHFENGKHQFWIYSDKIFYANNTNGTRLAIVHENEIKFSLINVVKNCYENIVVYCTDDIKDKVIQGFLVYYGFRSPLLAKYIVQQFYIYDEIEQLHCENDYLKQRLIKMEHDFGITHKSFSQLRDDKTKKEVNDSQTMNELYTIIEQLTYSLSLKKQERKHILEDIGKKVKSKN